MSRVGLGHGDARVILAALGSTATARSAAKALNPPEPPVPFVTISCEAGVPGMTLARAVVERLNRADHPGWTCWDRELVEKVASECAMSRHVLESLEESDHSWLSDFLHGLALSSGPSDEAVAFRHVATTIRALARAGRVVIVGRGGVYLTRSMGGGVHVRVIAPLKQRVANLAAELKLSNFSAEAELRRREHNQQVFYRHYFPKEALVPEVFTAVLNAGVIDEPHMAAAITALVPVPAVGSAASLQFSARSL
jgi:cytidylate kinase